MMLVSSTTSQPKKHGGGKGCYKINSEKVKIINRKKLVKNHLKKCLYFMHKVGGKEQVNNILNKEESEESSTKKLRLDYKDDKLYILVEDKSIIKHYHWLNPHLVLPSRKQLAGCILKSATETNKSYIQDKACSNLYGIMIAFNGWKNVINQEILGSVLIMSNEIFREIDILEIKINGLVTDSDAAYAASRCRLRLKYSNKIFLLYYAHQFNLCMEEIFKESDDFNIAMKLAIMVVAYFKNANHSYFISKLRDEQYSLYKHFISLANPVETQWNSFYYCVNSLLKSKSALKV
ncbi:20899_t:CDS:2, partial [Cetraspora pellucida]